MTVVKCNSALDTAGRVAAIRWSKAWAAERGIEQVPIIAPHDRVAVLACYGPSLAETAEVVRVQAEFADVFTCSGAHDLLIGKGIRIDGHVESDPRPHKAKFLRSPRPDVNYLLASTCHRFVFKNMEGMNVNIWHVGSSREEDRAVERAWPGAVVTMGGTNVGMSAIAVLSSLGYRRILVHGMDCSFSAPRAVLECANEGITDEMTRAIGFHAGAHPNEDQQPYRVWVGDRPFISSPQMMQSAQDFLMIRARTKNSKPKFQIDLHGDGFLKSLVERIDQGLPVTTRDRAAAGRLTMRTEVPC